MLGPTGSGKSSFIEALAGKDQELRISGGGLESVTQEIQVFKVNNAISCQARKMDWSVYLIDTPGFSDSKMSELQIIRKIYHFQRDKFCSVDQVFYFHRITDKRIPGTVRKIIDVIKAFNIRSISINIITTMWDNIHGAEALQRAENNFIELRDVIWKDEISNRAEIVKFQNTPASAIDIFGSTVIAGCLKDNVFALEDNNLAGPILFHELLDRLDSCRNRKNSLLREKIELFSNPNPELESIVVSSLEEAEEDLAIHFSQLMLYRRSPPGLENILQSARYQHFLDSAVSTQYFTQAIVDTLSDFHLMDHNSVRRSKLKNILEAAKSDFQLAYATLCKFGPPPSGSKPFVPSITISAADHAGGTLEVLQPAVCKDSNAIEQMQVSKALLTETADIKVDEYMGTDVDRLPPPSVSLVTNIANTSPSPPNVSFERGDGHALEMRALVVESGTKRGFPKKIKLAFYKIRRLLRRR
ncbi:hypothetical protein CVT24_010294 [Panaeolus cyanescens]|uniref:G domain-containing protein n=1 Tax=Panaeolus cyanescens TaxID=181874 RepID=A0A409W960_9AGAR|nr:hypothetical protein CVT24_010294 [Panaeolus cyanescens]